MLIDTFYQSTSPSSFRNLPLGRSLFLVQKSTHTDKPV